MDGDAALGHLSPLLREDGHARVRRLHGGYVPLEQDGDRPGARRILLGLLPNADPGGPRQ